MPRLKALKLELVGKEPCEETEGKVDGTDACHIKYERFRGRRGAGDTPRVVSIRMWRK